MTMPLSLNIFTIYSIYDIQNPDLECQYANRALFLVVGFSLASCFKRGIDSPDLVPIYQHDHQKETYSTVVKTSDEDIWHPITGH